MSNNSPSPVRKLWTENKHYINNADKENRFNF